MSRLCWKSNGDVEGKSSFQDGLPSSFNKRSRQWNSTNQNVNLGNPIRGSSASSKKVSFSLGFTFKSIYI